MLARFLPISLICYFNLDNDVKDYQTLLDLTKYLYQKSLDSTLSRYECYQLRNRCYNILKFCANEPSNDPFFSAFGCKDPDALYIHAILLKQNLSIDHFMSLENGYYTVSSSTRFFAQLMLPFYEKRLHPAFRIINGMQENIVEHINQGQLTQEISISPIKVSQHDRDIEKDMKAIALLKAARTNIISSGNYFFAKPKDIDEKLRIFERDLAIHQKERAEYIKKCENEYKEAIKTFATRRKEVHDLYLRQQAAMEGERMRSHYAHEAVFPKRTETDRVVSAINDVTAAINRRPHW